MTTSAKIGKGSTISINGSAIGAVVEIKPPNMSSDMKKATELDVIWEEFIKGRKIPGEVSFTVHLKTGDTNGIDAVIAAFNSESTTYDAYVITFPTALGTTWSFNAWVKAVDFSKLNDDPMTIGFTLTITGQPTLGMTASTGMSNLTGIEENAGGALDFIPNFAIGTFTYTVAVNTASTYVKFTPTAASHTITILNGYDSTTATVVTGNQSGALTIGAANTVTKFTITCYEANKAPKTYIVYVTRAAA